REGRWGKRGDGGGGGAGGRWGRRRASHGGGATARRSPVRRPGRRSAGLVSRRAGSTWSLPGWASPAVWSIPFPSGEGGRGRADAGFTTAVGPGSADPRGSGTAAARGRPGQGDLRRASPPPAARGQGRASPRGRRSR